MAQAFVLSCPAPDRIVRCSLIPWSYSYSSPSRARTNTYVNNNRKKRAVFSNSTNPARSGAGMDGNGDNYDDVDDNVNINVGKARTALVLLVTCGDTESLRDSIEGWLQGWAFDGRGRLSSPVSYEPPCSLRFYSENGAMRCTVARLTISLTGSLLFSNRVEITASADANVPGEGSLLRNLVDFVRTNSRCEGDSLEVLYKRRNLRLRKVAKGGTASDTDMDIDILVKDADVARVREWAESFQLGQFDASLSAAFTSTVVFRGDDDGVEVDVEVRDSDGSMAAVVRVSVVDDSNDMKMVRARISGKRRRAQTRRIVER